MDARVNAFSDAVLAAHFGAMPDGAAYCRLEYDGPQLTDLTVLYANAALHTLTGLQQLVGQQFGALFPESSDPKQPPQALLARVVEQGPGSPNGAYAHYRPAQDQWFSVAAYSPQPGHAMLMFRHIPDQHRVERSLLRSEARLRAVIETAPIPLCMNDDQGNIIYLNAAFRSTFGYTLDDIPNLVAWWPMAYPDPQYRAWVEEAWNSRLWRAQREGTAFEKLEVRVLCKDARVRTVVADMVPLGEAFESTHLVVLYDISEATAIHQALLENEVRMHSTQDLLNKLAEQVPGALFQFRMAPDGSFSVPYASQGMFEMFGLTAEQVAADASDIFNTIPAAQRAGVIQSVLHSAQALDNWMQVFPVTLAQGEQWRQAQSRPERLADGSILWHGFVSDATERVQAKAQLQEMNESLESRVQERTRELRSALDSAELAKTSRGQFLANMSHEIRTPMNTVTGMAHLALKTDPPPQLRQYLEKIQQSGAHLLTLINDILDFSKIDAGKLQLDLASFDLQQALRHVLQLNEGKATEKGLQLQLQIDPAVPRHVRADALRLSQILLNLLNNAIKFTERGGVQLRVRSLESGAQAPVAGSCLLRFEVVDSGIGVDPQQAQRLFKSFEQGDNSTTRRYGGTGLGLAICSQLASLMWGSVGVSGQMGLGSTFWLEVRLDVAAPPEQTAPLALRDVDAAMQVLCGKRVLVVDDNDFNLEVARGLLQDVAMEVQVARDGAQALDAVLRSAFDCVLMDVQMPVMDGLEAARRIRSTPALAGLVVIAMTANAAQEDQAKCLEAGMHAVIVKPVAPDDLFLTLAHWIGTPQRAPASTAAVAPALLRAAALPDLSTLLVWDASALARVVGNNPAAHARLLDKYRQTADETVAAMQRSAAQAHWAQAADLAHKLKSSSRSVGALRLGGLCEALERAGRSSDAVRCNALAAAVQHAYAEVLQRLPPV
jgi:PAS domain S-box-containing protein